MKWNLKRTNGRNAATLRPSDGKSTAIDLCWYFDRQQRVLKTGDTQTQLQNITEIGTCPDREASTTRPQGDRYGPQSGARHNLSSVQVWKMGGSNNPFS